MARLSIEPAGLSERVTIQQNTVTTDDQGGRSSSWGTLATVWASVRSLSSREAVQARAGASRGTYEGVVRYRTDVTASMRLSWVPSWSSGTPARTLEIHGVRPDRVTQTIALDCAEAA